MAAQDVQVALQSGSVTAQVDKTGRGEPLLYLHGAFGHQSRPSFVDSLAEHFTVYAPVHPGFVEPDGLEHVVDVLDLTLYHFDLLDALGLESAHVVGHFLGAMTGAEMAALCPHRVNRLVMGSPAGMWLDDNPGVDYFATPSDELRSILFNDPDSEVAREVMPEPRSDEEKAVQDLDRVRALSSVAKFLWPIPDKGLRKRAHRIKAPTLLVVAENDRIVPPAYGDELARLIPDSQLHKVRQAGHMFTHERPDEVAELLLRFLGA